MPAPIPIHLTNAERRHLQRVQREAKTRRVWARATALLLLGTGASVTKTAGVVSVCLNTVANWKHRWLRGRYFRLTDAHRSGRPPAASKQYLKLMAEAVERGPRSYGYQFTVWSSARLAAHLEEKTGIDLSPRQLRKWLSRQGFVFRRPKHTLKSRQNRRKVQAAKRHLAALKKGLSPILADTTFGSKTKPTFICILT